MHRGLADSRGSIRRVVDVVCEIVEHLEAERRAASGRRCGRDLRQRPVRARGPRARATSKTLDKRPVGSLSLTIGAQRPDTRADLLPTDLQRTLMSRNILIVAGVVASLAFPALAQASDASFKNAVLPYQTELGTDLVFLAGLTSAPSKSAAPSDASKLRTAQSQLAACARAARSQKPSSSAGRKAQAEMLQGLALAYSAAGMASMPWPPSRQARPRLRRLTSLASSARSQRRSAPRG